VQRLQSKGFQRQQIECALQEINLFIFTILSYRQAVENRYPFSYRMSIGDVKGLED
jgi:hypothetical protein